MLPIVVRVVARDAHGDAPSSRPSHNCRAWLRTCMPFDIQVQQARGRRPAPFPHAGSSGIQFRNTYEQLSGRGAAAAFN